MTAAHSKADNNKPRIMAVMGLLSASLVVTVVLAWQANLAATSHLRTAENALREYASLVADEFVRRAITDIGYYGFFQLANLLGNTSGDDADWAALRGAIDPNIQRAMTLAEQFFDFDPASDLLSTELSSENGTAHAALNGHLKSLRETGLGADEPFHLSRIETGDESRLLAFVTVTGATAVRWRGFEVDVDALSGWFEQAFGEGALLPPSLADGAIGNEVLYLSVASPQGKNLFKAGSRYDPYFLVEKTVGDEYQGILKGFVVTASIDPTVAPSLVIGGLPRSRLPLLAGLMILTVGLMVTAIWLLRREQSVMKMRSDFVAQVSHELRTPLTQIRMFAETLLMDRVRNDQERRRSLEIINRESQRLTHLVDNVLKFSRDNGGPVLSPVTMALAPLIEEVAGEFCSLSDKPQIETQLDDSLFASVDVDALRQILLNLLDNATKYGPPEQTVTLELSASGELARLTVSDRGPGIPTRDHERIWQDFYRLERDRENDTAVAGTGIGLSVVRELVRAHKGNCYVDPAYQHGARIVVELPRAGGA